MRQNLLISLTVLALGAGGFALTFGAAIRQEPDLIAVLSAISKSYIGDNQAVEIQPGQDRWIVRDLSAIDGIMQQRGWVYDDRAGAMMIYRQGAERLSVNCGQFSRFYAICERS